MCSWYTPGWQRHLLSDHLRDYARTKWTCELETWSFKESAISLRNWRSHHQIVTPNQKHFCLVICLNLDRDWIHLTEVMISQTIRYLSFGYLIGAWLVPVPENLFAVHCFAHLSVDHCHYIQRIFVGAGRLTTCIYLLQWKYLQHVAVCNRKGKE